MSEYTREKYQLDVIKFRSAMAGKRVYEHIVNKYFPKHRGEKKRKVRIDLVNALNGTSYSKAIELDIQRIMKEVYKEKTGKNFS